MTLNGAGLGDSRVTADRGDELPWAWIRPFIEKRSEKTGKATDVNMRVSTESNEILIPSAGRKALKKFELSGVKVSKSEKVALEFFLRLT